MELYKANFNLNIQVSDNCFEEARNYLLEDNMTKYLLETLNLTPIVNTPKLSNLKDKVIEIRWELNKEDKGNIMLTTKEPLCKEELTYLSNWVSGQNSDGLGEGFGQQPFFLISEGENHPVGVFDWETNKYNWKKVS